MKNIFKFMGIALMACSLMVACGDDPVEPTDTTTKPDTPVTPTSSYVVTWGGATQTTAVTEGLYYDYTANGFYVLQSMAAAGINGQDYVAPVFYAAVVGYQGSYYLAEQVGIGSYYPNAVVDEDEVVWYAATLNSSSYGTFDATEMKFDANVDIDVYNYDEFYAAVVTLLAADGYSVDDLENMDEDTYNSYMDAAFEQASTNNYTYNYSNFAFTASSSK